MDTILLCSNHIPLVTSIHNTFIEKYMMGANGSYVKVYLYLSKCIQAGEEDLSISSLADQMENTEKDVLRALNYWEKKGLLAITRNDDRSVILGIEVLNPDELPEHQPTERLPQKKKNVAVPVGSIATSSANTISSENVPNGSNGIFSMDMEAGTVIGMDTDGVAATGNTTGISMDTDSATAMGNAAGIGMDTDSATGTGNAAGIGMDTNSATGTGNAAGIGMDTDSVAAIGKTEIQHSFQVSIAQTKRLSKNQDFKWTCDVVESFLGRPLQPNEVQMISYMYDDLQFSSELIVHLYEYCTSLGKTHFNYIQKVALEWHKKDVKTPEDAQNASAAYNAAYSAVSKAFALGRALAAVERKYVDRWQKEWLMDLSVICEACDRTMLKLQHADFKYTEGILEKWHRTGIHTLRGVQEADERHARKKAERKTTQATVRPIRKGSQMQIVEHGLTKEAADELEKRLLNKA